MRQIIHDHKTFLFLGAVGLLILGLAKTGNFPYYTGTAAGFELPSYAEY